MSQKLREKTLESLAAVLPITLIVLVLSVLLVPMELGTMSMFLTGSVMLVIGMGLFQMGSEMAMTPLGEGVGVETAKAKKLSTVLLIAFFMGMIVTIAEPDLQVLAQQVPSIPNAVLISIHQNFFPESKYSGAQMFYNSHPKAKQMAQMLQKSFVSTINPGSNRKEKPVTGIYLLEHIAAPGVLVECGFLSNPGEESRLRTAEYQKKIACVIASALSGLDWQTIV